MIRNTGKRVKTLLRNSPVNRPISWLRKFRTWSSHIRQKANSQRLVLELTFRRKHKPTFLSRTQQAVNNAFRAMSDSRWGEAYNLWRDPVSSSITGEQQQLWHAGRTITDWILHPPTFLEATTGSYNPPNKNLQNTVVFSAITSHHDLSWPPGEQLASTDYIRFTDNLDLHTWNTWQNRPLEYRADSPVRSARWVKTHPHMLLPETRWAIWLDGNVIPVEGLHLLLTDFQKSGHPIAAIPHPLRTRVDEEVVECIRRGKDDPATIKEHHSMLGEDPAVGLWETNVCFYDLHHPHLKPLLSAWWSFMELGSHRDQISLPYAVAKTRSSIHPLLPQGLSTRSDPRFALLPHKNTAFHKAHTHLHNASVIPQKSKKP